MFYLLVLFLNISFVFDLNIDLFPDSPRKIRTVGINARQQIIIQLRTFDQAFKRYAVSFF